MLLPATVTGTLVCPSRSRPQTISRYSFVSTIFAMVFPSCFSIIIPTKTPFVKAGALRRLFKY